MQVTAAIGPEVPGGADILDFVGTNYGPAGVGVLGALMLLLFSVVVAVVNTVPDYFSLLETRWTIKLMGTSNRVVSILLVDLLLTVAISGCAIALLDGAVWSLLQLSAQVLDANRSAFAARPDFLAMWDARIAEYDLGMTAVDYVGRGLLNAISFRRPSGVLFYSAFFTSAWLWAYTMSALGSRVLLKMNSGVGFLLRVTDVERQPFRSMGFVSVIIVSVLFALGLPLVFL
jgi:hypothetical protein